jgi:hypothetical protein
MPLNLNFNVPPKKPASTKSSVDRTQSQNKEARKIKQRKYRSDLISLDSLRETLFLPEFKKEDDIIISFRYHTKEAISISEDGKFGIKYNEMTRDCTLYHYKKPIVFDYNLEMEAILRLDSEIDVFANIEITSAEDIMIRIVREEYAERKKLQLLGIDNAFRKEMIERQKQEEELEKIDEEYRLREELDNIYNVPNRMMEDLFGKGMEETVGVLEEIINETLPMDNTFKQRIEMMASNLNRIEKEEVKDVQANNSSSELPIQPIRVGGLIGAMPKKNSK